MRQIRRSLDSSLNRKFRKKIHYRGVYVAPDQDFRDPLDAEQKWEARLPELTAREVEFIRFGARIRQAEEEDQKEREIAAIAARKVEQYALELRKANEQLARALNSSRVEGSSEQATVAEAIISSAEQLDRMNPQLGSDESRALLDALLANAYQFRKLIRGEA